MFITQQRAQSIVDEMKASIHRDINIMDGDGVILASTNPARVGQLHQGALEIIRQGLPSLTIWANDPQAGVQRGINLPIWLDGQLVGDIGVTGDPEEVGVFGEIIKRMTEIMVASAQQAQQSELLDRAKGLFVENWLFASSPDWGELELRGRLLGLDINTPYTVALVTLSGGGGSGAERAEDLDEMRSGLVLRMIQAQIENDPRHFCALIRSRIIILLQGAKPKQALSLLRRICQDISGYFSIPVSAGISGTSQSPEDIRRRYLEARTASAAAQGTQGQVVFYNQVSLTFLVQSIPAPIRRDLEELIFSACSPKEREEFKQLILLYFDLDGDIRRCAEHLFVHRNTFQYRMDRLRERTGYDLRIPKEAMLLYLAAQGSL